MEKELFLSITVFILAFTAGYFGGSTEAKKIMLKERKIPYFAIIVILLNLFLGVSSAFMR